MVTISEGNMRVSIDTKHVYVNSVNTNGFLKLELADYADLVKAIEALQSVSK